MGIGRLVALSVLLTSWVARAEAPPPPAPEPQFHWKQGPQPIELGHQIRMDLPAHYIFLGMPEADTLLKRFGGLHNENLLGVVASDDPNAGWFVTVRYDEDGHVDDSEKVDADQLLRAITDGTNEVNKERVQKGFPALHIDGWSEPPVYQPAVHHLVWALLVSTTRGRAVNYNTRVLGRRGVVSINLVTNPEALAADRVHARDLLAATAFEAGARYEDFDKKTDKVAEYGLVGLILGGVGLGAVKLAKVGLLAAFGKYILAFLLAAKKALILVFVAIGAGVKRLFGKKPAQPPAAAGAAPPDPPSSSAAPPSGGAPPSGSASPSGSAGPPDDDGGGPPAAA